MEATATVAGGEKLQARLKELAAKVTGRTTLKVGYLEGATYPGGGLNVATVALLQDRGAPRAGIPPRPFFRNAIAQNAGHWGDDVANALVFTDYDATKAMELMGDQIKGEVQQSIVDTDAPALSPVTLMVRQIIGPNGKATFADVQEARRRVAAGETASNVSTKPLVWTNNLLNSVDYNVDSSGS